MRIDKYKIFVASLIFSFGLTSCLNDANVDDQELGLINLNTKKIIEIKSDASHVSSIISLDEGVKEYKFEINLAAENPAAEDVVVNIEAVTEVAPVIKSVRARLGDQYPATGEDSIPDEDIKVYPASSVTIPATLTIPKGSRSANLSVKIDTHKLVGDAQFLLIRIKSVNNAGYIVSGNFGDLLLNMKVKSIYDGIYICNGYRIRPGNPTEAVVNEERHLSTVNGSTVQDPKFGTYSAYHVNVEVTGVPMIVGGVTCYKVNATPVDGTGAVVGGMYSTFTGDPATSPAAPANPTEINYYNPTTKTFVLNCFYISSINRIMYEVLVRKD